MKKDKKFKLLDLERDGKGISKKSALKESGLKRFFITFKDNFGKILTTNIIMVLGNFPIFFIIAVLSGFTRIESYLPASDLFQNLGGIFMIESPSPFQMTLYALEGIQTQVLVNTTLTYVFLAIGALTLLTFGIVNVGTAYILRNIAMGEPVFVWSDFIYAVKRNWKQALPFGMLDLLINAILAFNIYSTVTAESFATSIMFWANVVLVILYFFMRCYIYVQMVTFKLTVFKILKNSLIFALLGFKRNIMSLLGTLLLIVLEVLFVFSLGGVLLSFGVAMPLAIMFSAMAYMKVFAAYFKIKEIMIDPYKEEHPDEFERDDVAEDDVIMHDDVTERERLEEIKRKNGLI